MRATSWFHKLRGKRRKGRRSGASPSPTHGAAAVTATAACTEQHRQPPPCAGYSPNRASYYFPTAERARGPDGGLRCIAPRGHGDDAVLDVRVDVVHRRVGRLGGADAPPATPELGLRRIVARHAARDELLDTVPGSRSSGASTTSAATTPSTSRARGFHVKPASRRRRQRGHDDSSPRKDKDKGNEKEKEKGKAAATAPLQVETAARRRRWLYESLVVVKTSSDPEREMAESMAEMVAANRIRSSDDLEELLACYLALNAAEHHRAVVAAFRRVWLHLQVARQTRLHPRH